jgi:YidC/Oxa1 family membrane protein insertase
MDRRMLLAMVLAVGVLLLNSLFFGTKNRTQRDVPARPDSSQSAPIAPGRISPAPPTATAKPVASSAPAGMLRNPQAESDTTSCVWVETNLVRAEFDPVGGALRSWKMKRYTDGTEMPADLVRTRERGALWFALRDGDRVIRTDSTRFLTVVERDAGETAIHFTAEDPAGIRVRKTYRIPKDRYDCGLEISVEGLGAGNEGGVWEIGWVDGLPSVERDPRGDHYAAAAIGLFGKEYVRTGASRGVFGCAGGSGGPRSEVNEGTLRWFGVRNKYFLGALLLDQPRQRRMVTSFDPGAHAAGAILMEPLSMTGVTETAYRLYLGPIHYTMLESYGVGLERVQDLGPGVMRPFSKLLMKFFVALNKLVPNFGIEILILSILIRAIFYPLTKKSMDSMKRMQRLKPEMDRINEKYKSDPERKNREVLELYRKNKINPLGGCLPVVVQLPVLSGLYYVLANAVQLRKEPFAFWIKDLSAPDTVAHVAGFPVNILPLVMAATMVWQQKLTPTDPRQASLGYMMPIFMTFLFYSTPSGLVFYWTVSNLMTVLQQVWMNRGVQEMAPVVVDAAPIEPGGRRKGRT